MADSIKEVPPPLQHYRLSIQSGRRRQAVITTKLVTATDQASLDAEIAKLRPRAALRRMGSRPSASVFDLRHGRPLDR